MGRPGAEWTLWRSLRQPRSGHQIRLFENGRHPETIVELRREIELDMGDKRVASDRPQIANTRRVA